MSRIRTAAAVSAAALLGIAVLAGCSSSSDSASTASASAAGDSAGMLPPVIVTEDQASATCAVGDKLDIIIPEANISATTVASSDEALVSVTQPKQEGDALFNAGGECLAAGDAVVTVTNPDGSTRDIAVTVTQ